MKIRDSILMKAVAAVSAIALLLITFSFAACGDPPDPDDSPKADPALTGNVLIPGFIKVGVEAEATVINVNAKSLTYKWQISNSENDGFSNFTPPPPTNTAYTPVVDDVGKYLRVVVTAKNYKGSLTSNVVQVKSADAEEPVIESVGVSPKTLTIMQDNSQQFEATVNGSYTPSGEPLSTDDQKVTWTLTGTVSNGTSLSATGLLTIAANQTVTTLTVTATSVIDPTKKDSATVTVSTGNEPQLTGTVTITAAIKIGDTVQANTSALDGTGALHYQWQQNSISIDGATSASYTVSEEVFAEGDYISVRVTRTGYRSHVDSNGVYVRGKDTPLPVVSSVTVLPEKNEVSKGGEVGFSATVTGENLSQSSDSEVIWSVNSTNPGTRVVSTGSMGPIGSVVSSGTLEVAANETATTLTVTATSAVTSTVKGTATVTVKAAEGKVLTISGLTGQNGVGQVTLMSDLSSMDDTSMVAMGGGNIINNTLTVVLYEASSSNDGGGSPEPGIGGDEGDDSGKGWNGTGSYNVVLTINSMEYIYVYTAGGNLNMANLVATPKYNFNNATSTIAFNQFKQMQIGAGGHTLTISGFSNRNGSTVYVSVADYSNNPTGDSETSIAWGQGTISSNSLTVTLAEPRGITGWTASGSHQIELSIQYGDDQSETYLYTNSQPITQLGIEDWADYYKAPKYGFSGASTSLNLNTFAKVPQKYYVQMNGSLDGGDIDGVWHEYTEGATVTLTVNMYNPSYEVVSFSIIDERNRPVLFEHTAGYKTVTFTMPGSDVYVSATSQDPAQITRKVNITQSSGGTITANPTTGKAGNQITLTINPGNGRQLTNLVITDADGKAVNSSYTPSSYTGGNVTFSLPMSDVTVTGTFNRLPGTGISLSGTITLTGPLASNEHLKDIYVYATYINGDGITQWLGSDRLENPQIGANTWEVMLNEDFDTSTEVTVEASVEIGIGTPDQDGNYDDEDYFSKEVTRQVFDADISNIDFTFNLTRVDVSGTVGTITLGGSGAGKTAAQTMVVAYTGTYADLLISAGISSGTATGKVEYVGTAMVDNGSWTMKVSADYAGQTVGFAVGVVYIDGEDMYQGIADAGSKAIPAGSGSVGSLGSSFNITQYVKVENNSSGGGGGEGPSGPGGP